MNPFLNNYIACFYINQRKVNTMTTDMKCYAVYLPPNELYSGFNPADFYRTNQQFVLAKKAIKDVDFWFDNRLCIHFVVSVYE